LETTNGITVNDDGTFTVTAVTMVASKSFAWEAVG
jgi:predicted phage tail protein